MLFEGGAAQKTDLFVKLVVVEDDYTARSISNQILSWVDGEDHGLVRGQAQDALELELMWLDDGLFGQHKEKLRMKSCSYTNKLLHTKHSASLVSLRLRLIALLDWAEEEVVEAAKPGVPEGRRRSLLSMVARGAESGRGDEDE